jgi:type I restriction-modification system DNA methylase subunit
MRNMNERITEDLVRSHFKNDSLYSGIKFEEQRTNHKIIKQLLKTASKRGTGKQGYPEFTITFPSIIDAAILVECKPDTKLHRSRKGEKPNPEKYAVDGVLHYSKFLNNEFNVIAIAVSGLNEDNLLISNFFIKKGTSTIVETPDKKLLTIYDYLNLFEEKDTAEKLKDENLLVLAADLNQELYNYSVPENERATIVSGILLALQNKAFRASYKSEASPRELVEDLLVAIRRVLKKKNMGAKTPVLMGEYRKICQSHSLAIAKKLRNNVSGEEGKNTLLRDIIFELDKKVLPFTQYDHSGYDILGQFYSEFIRYVNGDKKLGLVLTPQHVAELFVDIADIHVDDVIYDNCCGTAGFLIKARKKLMELAGNDTAKKDDIDRSQLIGVEKRSDMFAYACSNMIMRGDGKSNIYYADSLSSGQVNKMRTLKPTVGFLNPPYSTGVSELEFVYSNLECLQDGTCVAIVPLNCVTDRTGKDYEWKKKLLEKHTLEAVFSMPDQLFNPSSSMVTAIIVLKANIPHPKNYETYFGYWKDDGFIKVKHLGRVDHYGKWKAIKADWIYNYRNKKEVKGQSIKRCVSADDEWCAEAYMETDYAQLKREDFEPEMKKYVLFEEMS